MTPLQLHRNALMAVLRGVLFRKEFAKMMAIYGGGELYIKRKGDTQCLMSMLS